MSTVTINGLPTYPGSVDGVNDLIPIFDYSGTSANSVSRNNFLNIASQPVGLSDFQTLTNKTLTSPTVSSPTFSGTLAGTYTIGGTPTFPSSVVQLSATQTLTSKTLTSPTITSPTITNAINRPIPLVKAQELFGCVRMIINHPKTFFMPFHANRPVNLAAYPTFK